MTPPLLDTHAWIWWIDQDPRLGASTIAVLDALPRDQRPFLCDISLWEVAMLVERGRIEASTCPWRSGWMPLRTRARCRW